MEERKAQQEAARARIVMITAGELADLHGEIAELRKEVAALQVQLAVATNPAVAAVPAPPTRQPVDPLILKAIRDHELAPGMTVEQAERSLGAKSLKLEIDEEGQRVKWTITKSNGSIRQTQTIEAWFKDGKLTRSTFFTDDPEVIERRIINVGASPSGRRTNVLGAFFTSMPFMPNGLVN